VSRPVTAGTVTALLWLGVAAPSAARQSAEQSPTPAVTATVGNFTRVETWRFFDPPSDEVEPDYTFVGNRAFLEVDARGVRFDVGGGFAYVRLENLPRRAIGPGGLGSGAFYFAATGLSYSYQVYLTTLTLGIHSADRRSAVTVGRMTAAGALSTPPRLSAPSPALPGRPYRTAADGRLLGDFGWSLYQRRFDGVRVDLDRHTWSAAGGVFMPTQGGYEESSNLTMTRLQVAQATVGFRHGASASTPLQAETHAFTAGYRDRRPVGVRPDNTGVPADGVNVMVGTLGASHAGTRDAASGVLDWNVWGAWQWGGWYGQRHRAVAGAVEGGHRWTASAGRPWLGAGLSYASGDGDGADDRHGTFFPMLPDMPAFAQSMVYAQMNLRDLFVRFALAPHRTTVVRIDLHRLDLADPADRWYQGSGATASQGLFFGYSGRPSGGDRGLGSMLETTADVTLNRFWSIRGYAGHMWGGPVVGHLFAGQRLTYWYIEQVLRFSLRTGG
jgi:hypothetical protein